MKIIPMSLTKEEEKVLEDIQEFFSNLIPVVHYNEENKKDPYEYSPVIDIDDEIRESLNKDYSWLFYKYETEEKKNKRQFFFHEDYSWFFSDCKHAGHELMLLLKLYAQEKNTELWEAITAKEGDKDYIKSCMTIPQMVEALYKDIKEILTNEPCEFDKLSDEFSDANGDIIPQDAPTQNFVHHLRSIRNKWEHTDKTYQLFLPPSDKNDEIGKKQFWHDFQRRFIVYALMIFNHKYDALYAKLVKKEFEANANPISEEDESALNSKGKAVIGLYIQEVHKQMLDKMRKRISEDLNGTELKDLTGMCQYLPDLQLKKVDFINEKDSASTDFDQSAIGDAQLLLANDTEHNVKVVVGEAGSGKSILFYRMIQRDQPRLTPIYLPLDDKRFAFAAPEAMVHRLDSLVIGHRLLTLTACQLAATKERLRKRLEEGSVVFFIDALDAAPEQLPLIQQFITTYPSCQYIIGTQPDCLERMQDDLKQLKAKRYDILPLNTQQQRQLAATASLHISDTDHTDILMENITNATQGSEMSRLPFSMMLLISIFENSNDNTTTINNQPSLYYELEKKIKNSKTLDKEERERLLGQGVLKIFRENCQTVINLCQDVYESYNNPNSSRWEELILNNSMVQRDMDETNSFRQWRTLYEYIEVVASRDDGWNINKNPSKAKRDKTDYLNTLLTVTLLKQGISKQQIKAAPLPSPNPMLIKLAQATATLKLRLPQENNYSKEQIKKGNENCKSMVAYRLQPRYIVQQYLLTVMEQYRRNDKVQPITFRNFSEQLVNLFNAIAYSGSPILIERLFNPFWMRLWLINKEDQLPIQSAEDEAMGNGLAFDGSPLPEILIHHSTNHVLLIRLLLKQLVTWVKLWNLPNTERECRRIIRDIIIFNMSDKDREILVKELSTKEIREEIGDNMCDYYSNMAIASMDSLSLFERFKLQAEMQGSHIIEHLKSKQSDPRAICILLSLLEQIMSKRNKRSRKSQKELDEQIYDICKHLISCGIANIAEESLRQRFWNFVKQLIDNRNNMITTVSDGNIPNLAIQILDFCPLEDIEPSIAKKIYDIPVFTYLQEAKKEERRVINKWVKPKNAAFNHDLYRQVTEFFLPQKPRNSIKYAFYSHPTPSRFFVATECINEMPEGKYCQLNNNNEQWFYVEDVQILKNEHPIEYIAELTINLPVGAKRWSQGTLTLNIPTTDGNGQQALNVSYCHLFDMGAHPQVVVRTEDQTAINILNNEATIKYLKQNRNMLWGGQPALLSGIDIRPLKEHMRIIELRPVTVQKTPRFTVLHDIPHAGHIKFYNKAIKDKDNKPLQLAITGPDTQGAKESLSTKERLNSFVYLGQDKNNSHKFIAVDNRSRLNEGNVLVWDEKSWAISKVVKVYDANEIKKYDKLIKQVKTEIWKENKEKGISQKIPDFVQIVELENINRQQAPFVNKLGLNEKKADVSFYMPIADPVRSVWTRKEEQIVVKGVLAIKEKVYDEYVLAIPADAEYPDNIRFYDAANYSHRQPIEWYEPKNSNSEENRYKYIKLNKHLIDLWKGKQSVYFYPDSEQQEPINIQLSEMSTNVDLKSHKRYHADIVPILQKEWLHKQNGKLTEEQESFCKQKNPQFFNK